MTFQHAGNGQHLWSCFFQTVYWLTSKNAKLFYLIVYKAGFLLYYSTPNHTHKTLQTLTTFSNVNNVHRQFLTRAIESKNVKLMLWKAFTNCLRPKIAALFQYFFLEIYFFFRENEWNCVIEFFNQNCNLWRFFHLQIG